MRSRLRRLHVDGRAYMWTARIDHAVGPDQYCHRCIRLRIWGAGKNGRALQVDLMSTAAPGPWGDPCATDEVYPQSPDVRAIIEYALRRGWEPDAVGGSHVLAAVEALVLPRFVVTDLFRTAGPMPG